MFNANLNYVGRRKKLVKAIEIDTMSQVFK